MATTPTDAIREAHERQLDMQASIRQRAAELQAERDTQRAQEAARDASASAQQ